MTGPNPAPAGLGVRLVDRRIRIDAPPARVYSLLTDAAELVRWMAPEADVEAWPGGVITWKHANGDRVSGHFVELVPDRRIVFTYGWDRADVGIPPGSTRVEITLTSTAASGGGVGTDLHLIHRGLSGPMADAHDGGWANYLARLEAVAGHGDAGPDPFAGDRVPSATDQLDQAAGRFAVLTQEWLDRPEVTNSTMMGLPCLRREGAFFVAYDRRTGDLLVKLSEQRVLALIADGHARPFAPAGRRFRQWAAIPADRAVTWVDLMEEAYQFSGGAPPA